MKKAEYFWIIVVVNICVSLYSSLAKAEFTVSSSISLREEYNDNIQLSNSGQEGDFITTVNPSISLGYNIKPINLSFAPSLNFRFYKNHPENNQTSLSNAADIKFDSTIKLYREIVFLRVTDVYQRVTIDERGPVALDNSNVNMTASNHFNVNPYVEYPLSGTLKTRLSYSYDKMSYKSSEGDDTETELATLSLIKEISSAITTSLSYSYSWHSFQTTENYNKQDVTLGATYQVSQLLSLNGSIGETWFYYKTTTDSNATVWSMQAHYNMSENFSIGAVYAETYNDSVDEGTYLSKSLTGTIGYKGNIPVTLNIYRRHDVYNTVDREDRTTGLGLSAKLPLKSKLSAGITGTYSNSTFLPQEETARRYGLGLSFSYPYRKAILSAGYTYNLSDSNTVQNQYTNNIVWLQAKMSF